MLSAIAIIPSAPVLVPELAGAAAAEAGRPERGRTAAAALLPPRWIGVGTGACGRASGPEQRRHLRGLWRRRSGRAVTAAAGARRRVRRSDLPLCALIAGWVRGQARPEAGAQVRVYRGDHAADTALARGRQLRAEIDRLPDPIGVLVVADGANTLTRPPQAAMTRSDAEAQLVARRRAGQRRRRRADPAARPDPGAGRLPGAGRPDRAGPAVGQGALPGAPYGVGYFAGVWQP